MLTGRTQRIIIDTILLGIVGALGAQVFTLMLKWVEALLMSGLTGYTPPGLPDEGGVLKQVIGPHGMWLVPLATTLGGLISGILVYSLAPEAEGHGTDTAVKAFHHAAGFTAHGGHLVALPPKKGDSYQPIKHPGDKNNQRHHKL